MCAAARLREGIHFCGFIQTKAELSWACEVMYVDNISLLITGNQN